MKRYKVVVCGTGFGKYYIKGILKLKQLFKLVGIVSTGSKKSLEVAEECKVPLITDINCITPETVDIACVVIKSTILGGNGTEIALRLLEKGIHVIQEQPIHFRDYQSCLLASKKTGCKYQLNTFYPNLYAINKFINISNKMKEIIPITYIIAESSIQVLFPLLDILNKIFEGLSPYKLERLNGELKQRFRILVGNIKSVPITLLIDNQMNVDTPESNMALFHRITLGTTKGKLTLTDTHGTVLWTPIIHEELRERSQKKKSFLESIKVQEEAISKDISTLGEIFDKQWPEAMERGLTDFYNSLINHQYITVEDQRLLTLCQIWQEIGNMLGPYEEVEKTLDKPVSLKEMGIGLL